MSKILKIGNSHGVIIDSQTRAEAGLAPGDDVVMAPVEDGVYITKRGTKTAAVFEAANALMQRNARVYEILKDR